MSNPTAQEVKRIIATALDDDAINQMIEDAAMLGGACVDGYDADRRKIIIRWLTAHLIASSHNEGALQSESLGDASETYARAQLGDSLRGTVYGQQALALDAKGCLSRIGKKRASVQVI